MGMFKKDVVRYYGSMAAAGRAMGISKSAVSQWPELVPELWAYKIQVLTKGALRLDPKLYASPPSKKPTEQSEAAA